MKKRVLGYSSASLKKKSLDSSPYFISHRSSASTKKKSSILFLSPNSSDFKNVVSILKKKPEYRLKIDLEILIEGTESNNFFVDTINEYGPETHSECCRYMTYKHLNINEILFQYGSIGYEFYIVLAGSVGVFVWLSLSKEAIIERTSIDLYSKFIDLKYPPSHDKYLTEIKILKTGESFGELALLGGRNKPRIATIIAKEESHFAVLERSPFLKILKEKEEKRLMSHVNFLMNLSFLANIPFENVKSIYLFCEIKKFPLNAIIYTEEDETDYFYMIKSGQFLISKTRKNLQSTKNSHRFYQPFIKIRENYTKKNINLALLGPNQFFGEIELIEKTKRKFTVICKEQNSTVYILSKKDFIHKIEVEPCIIAYFIAHIAETRRLYDSFEAKISKTFEQSEKLMKEIEGSTRNKSPYPDENNYLTAPIALLTYRRKTTPNEEENIYKLIQGRKFSFCSNEWKVKDFEKEHKNQSLNEENVIINNRIRENDSLKNVFSENDYISFLNLKLSKFKEYKSKQTQEKKNKNEVFSNLFEENLVKTNSKRSLQIKLKNVAETIRKKNIKNKISIDYEKLQVEKKEVINKNPLEKFFMKEEKNLNLIRNKIIKVFNNEMKVFKGVGSRSTKALSFNSNLLL